MDNGGHSHSCQNLSDADEQRVNGKKVREVGRRVSRHTVVANTCKFVLDTSINGQYCQWVANEERQGEGKYAHV